MPAGSATSAPERSEAGRKTTGNAGPRRAAGKGGHASRVISSPPASVALSSIAGPLPGAQSRVPSVGASCRSSIQTASSTFDLPTLGPPTSAHTGPGEKPTARADRKPRIRTSETPNDDRCTHAAYVGVRPGPSAPAAANSRGWERG